MLTVALNNLTNQPCSLTHMPMGLSWPLSSRSELAGRWWASLYQDNMSDSVSDVVLQLLLLRGLNHSAIPGTGCRRYHVVIGKAATFEINHSFFLQQLLSIWKGYDKARFPRTFTRVKKAVFRPRQQLPMIASITLQSG